MEVISIILGVLLVIGLFFLPKEKAEQLTGQTSIIFQGVRTIKRLLLPGIAIALIGFGIYYWVKQRNENDKRITFNKLINIINTPHHEREPLIIGMGFQQSGRGDKGTNYARDYGNEIIEKWDMGIIRYLTKDENNYIRLRKEVANSGFKFDRESKNNMDDVFTHYANGSIFITSGIFSTSKDYVIVVEDTTKYIEQEAFLKDDFMHGKWGRITERNSGNFVINKDNTFTFYDSDSGPIKGTMYIEGKEIVFNYGKANDKRFGYSASFAHPFNEKSEVIIVSNKLQNEISGKIKGESLFSDIILRRQ